MALDSRFICSGDIESFFVDKLTALPLSAGVVKFYSDSSRTTPKAVYKLTGAPGSYAYVSLGNTMTLNAAGEYQDGGNPIVIYYFPFVCTTNGDPSTSTGAQELYYITVENSGATQQYVRDAWPPLATNLSPIVTGNQADYNYIPNGQFLYRNTSPITESAISGVATTGTVDAKQIAQGGWSWQQSTGSTGVYVISFNSETAASGLKDFPFASVNIQCTSFGTETVHDLVMQWPGVNSFASLLETPTAQSNSFNLLVAGKTASGSQTFTVHVISNYGTGGSATVDTQVGSFTLGTAYTYNNINIPASAIPGNTLATIGAGNFFAISIRTPANSFNARFTDFALTYGNKTYSAFPIKPEDEMLSNGVAGYMPTPAADGSDLYLPLRLTPKGLEFDNSVVGTIIPKPQLVAKVGEILMSGQTFTSSSYSSDGIPYSRLANYLIANDIGYTTGGSTIPAANIPLFGTGPNFVSIWTTAAPGDFIVNYNTASASNSVTVATASPTGFTAGALAPGNRQITMNIPAAPAASTFFSFTPNAGGALVYNVWFAVNNAGTEPATPTGGNIRVDIASGASVATVRLAVQAAINRYKFYVMDMRGYFLRGLGGIDPDLGTRSSQVTYDGSSLAGTYMASGQTSIFASHDHPGSTVPFDNLYANPGGGLIVAGTGGNEALSIAAQGGAETRPINIGFYYFIKY